MAGHSKHHQTFSNRLLHLDADLELIDIIDVSIKDGLLTPEPQKLFVKISEKNTLYCPSEPSPATIDSWQ